MPQVREKGQALQRVFHPPSFAKGPCGQLLLGCPSPLSSRSVSAHPHGCSCRTVTSPCPLPGHTALATGRGLGLTLRCSQGMLWLGDSSRTSSLPGGQRASRTAALTLCSVLSLVTWRVREEGKAGSPPCSPSEQSAAWPWHCCLRMPWQLLVLECPALPAMLSNLTWSCRVPVGSVSAWGPPVLLQELLHP